MIAVAGGKGGTGKTTTTLGVGRALTRTVPNTPILVADADWDLPNLRALASTTDVGDHTPASGCRTGANGSDPYTPMDETEAIEDIVEAITDERGTNRSPKAPVILDPPVDPRSCDPRRVLGTLSRRIPREAVVLVDCPAGSAPDAVAPLRVADASLLVTTLSPAALRDTAKTAAMARMLECDPIGVVVTRAETVPTGVPELLGCPLLGSVPTAGQSPLRHRSVTAAYERIAHGIETFHR